MRRAPLGPSGTGRPDRALCCYIFIYNIYKCCPSNKAFKYTHPNATRGYSHGSSNNDTAHERENYVIKSWLGPFAGASTQMIDTALSGTIPIIITLANPDVLSRQRMLVMVLPINNNI